MSLNGSLLIQNSSCIWHECPIKDEPVKNNNVKQIVNTYSTKFKQFNK